MSLVAATEVLQMIAAQRTVIGEQEARLAKFETEHRAEQEKLEQMFTRAKQDLGNGVLTKLDAASIATVANAIGLPGMVSEDLPGKIEARHAWIGARRKAIADDPRYATRELLRHPRTGSLTRALGESVEDRRLVQQTVDACEHHPRFERLWTTKFGTPEESAAWWRYSTWLDRSAAKQIAAALSKATFAEVRTEYEESKQRILVFDAEVTKLRAEVAAGEGLEDEYAALGNEERTLDATNLEAIRQRVVEHLLGVDASIIQQHLRAASSPFLLLFLRTSGLASKMVYLDGIRQKNEDELRRELATQRERLDRAETKTRRHGAPMPTEAYQKLAEDRRARYDKRWLRTTRMYESVRAYDRWERARYYNDLLWWDVMTRGRYDGSYIPEVASFHDAHPSYQYDPNWKVLATTYGYQDGFSMDAGSTGTADDALAASAAIDADGAIDSGRERGDAGEAVDIVGTELATTDAS